MGGTLGSPSISAANSGKLESVADSRTGSSAGQVGADVAVRARAKALPLAPPTPDALPQMVPARMLNELLYCERLMYLEWVQGEWADNRYTADGKAVHKRVDQRSQVLKVADGSGASAAVANKPGARGKSGESSDGSEELPYTARSVWLSSERLGLTAKIDVIDVEGQRVVPIEYKRGKCPEQGPYLPERAQLAAQVLLLRDQGYQCDFGELYFSAEKRRVRIDVDDSLERTVMAGVARARALSLEGKCPPPLDDSPKCRGCSLAEICLPDEVKALQDFDEELRALDDECFEVGDDPAGIVGPEPDPSFEEWRVRRLFPARDDKVPLYVQDRAASVRLSGGRLIVTVPGQPATMVRLVNTSSVTLFGNVQITTQALRRLMDEGVPVLFATSGGWLVGRAMGTDTKNVELRSAQYQATQSVEQSLAMARAFVTTKILNCRTLLRRNHKGKPKVALSELKQLARKARETSSMESLLGLEGAAARTYFQEFSGMLKDNLEEEFHFERRNRRPPRDPINALLSFCYSLLVRETNLAAQAVGLDPLLGFYHQPRFGRPSLALDLMEEFRPVLADSTVLSVINNGIVSSQDFVRGQGSVGLKPPARKRVIQAMQRRMDQLVTHPIFDYRLSYRRVLEVQARLLSRLLLGELPAYPGFKVR